MLRRTRRNEGGDLSRLAQDNLVQFIFKAACYADDSQATLSGRKRATFQHYSYESQHVFRSPVCLVATTQPSTLPTMTDFVQSACLADLAWKEKPPKHLEWSTKYLTQDLSRVRLKVLTRLVCCQYLPDKVV
jgi:hypothetical protein